MFDPNNPFRNPDNLVNAVRAVLSGQKYEHPEKEVEEHKTDTPHKHPHEEAMDPVNPKAVKKKFKDRKDKDIDNDGDVDSSDKFLHKRRKAISKAVAADEAKDSKSEAMKDDEEDQDTDVEKDKKKKKDDEKKIGKKDDIDTEPKQTEVSMVSEKEMSDDQMKKREEIIKSMKKDMPKFKERYGDRTKEVMFATATKMAMKK